MSDAAPTESIAVHPLAAHHAGAAARLHIQGQPHTFLTALGPRVLEVLYRVLPQSSDGFGFVVLSEGEPVAFVAITASTLRLFIEMGTRRLPQLLPALLRRYLRRPALLVRSVQTVFYPLVAGRSQPGEQEPAAELLSIMTQPDRRGQGLGSALMAHVVAACQEKGIRLLDVTVDEENRDARRFYKRHHFQPRSTILLSGRPMRIYRRSLAGPNPAAPAVGDNSAKTGDNPGKSAENWGDVAFRD